MMKYLLFQNIILPTLTSVKKVLLYKGLVSNKRLDFNYKPVNHQEEIAMGSIDDLKKNIHIEDVDEELRGKMFNEFVQKGGKVVNESKKQAIQFDRNKQQMFKNIEEKRKRDLVNNKVKPLSSETVDNNTAQNQTIKKSKNKYNFFVFLRGVFVKVFTFSKTYNTNFTGEIIDVMSQVFKEINQISTPILSLSDEKKWQVYQKVNSIDPFAYEIIVRTNRLTNENNFKPIYEYFKYKTNIICPSIIPNLTVILKELVILYSSYDKINNILASTLNIYFQSSSLQPTKPKIIKNLTKLFNYFLPRIFIIVNYNTGKNYKPTYNEMYKMLSIKSADDIGSITIKLNEEQKSYYKNKELENEMEKKKKEQDGKENSDEHIPRAVKNGLIIINDIIKNIPELITRDITGGLFEPNEKMLQLYFLLKTFDERHSFIMTTFQIDYEPIIVDRERVDVKAELNRMNLKFNDLLNIIKDYKKIMENFHYVNNNKVLKLHLRDQQLEEIHRDRLRTFHEFHQEMTSFFKGFTKILQKLIIDYNDEKRLIENPDDILVFNIGKIKHYFENTSIIKAIFISYTFTAAVYYYLTNNVIDEDNLYLDGNKEKKDM